jgi:hypothetical protein
MDQPVPTPARCSARHASPARRRLDGAKTAAVDVDVALMRNAIINRAAAIYPSTFWYLPGIGDLKVAGVRGQPTWA